MLNSTRFALKVARYLFAEYANVVYPIVTNQVAGGEHRPTALRWPRGVVMVHGRDRDGASLIIVPGIKLLYSVAVKYILIKKRTWVRGYCGYSRFSGI